MRTNVDIIVAKMRIISSWYSEFFGDECGVSVNQAYKLIKELEAEDGKK